MIIGLTGRIGSGKEAIANFFREKGFCYLNISDEIRDEAEKRDISMERTKLQDLGNELRIKEGMGVWTRRILKKMELEKNYIVDGIKNPGEVAELKKRKDFVLIGVDSPEKQRFERLLRRGKSSDPKTWEDFLEVDKRDLGEDNPYGQQVSKCLSVADFLINNDKSLEFFNIKIEEAWLKIKIIQRNLLYNTIEK